MRSSLRSNSALVLLAGLGLSVALAPAALASVGTMHGIAQDALIRCQSCHSSESNEEAGGLKPAPAGGGEQLGGWRDDLVGEPPTNDAARGADKLRVHPGVPWNSYIIDKLTGDLKAAEGEAMRSSRHPELGAGTGEPAEVYACPGVVDEFYNWILDGAPNTPRIVPGDFDWSTIHCDRVQRDLGTLAEPVPGFQVNVDSFTINRPEREASRTITVPVGNASEAWVGRIEILASSGTEYLAVRRVIDGQPEEAPIAVARGQIDRMAPFFPEGSSVPSDFRGDRRARVDVELPEGVALRLEPGQDIEIEHRIRNDYWIRESDSTYRNETVGDAIVNLHTVPSDGVDSEATPFIDTTGTEALVVPPRQVGATGGVWGDTVRGALVGIWTDQRWVLASLSEATSRPVNTGGVQEVGGPDVTYQYVPIEGSDPAPTAVSYACVHSNGFHDNVNALPSVPRPLGNNARLVSRPIRYGCTETSGVPEGLPGGPAEVCYRAGDCGEAATCEPANLVGGPGVNDGRCTLIGLSW